MKRSQLHPTTLREIADVEGIQVGPFGSQLHVADYVERGVAVVMPSQMSNGAIDFGTCAKITASKAKELETHALRPGDLIFARRGDVGRLAVYSQRDPVAICGTGCIRVRLRVGVSASIVAEACMHPVAQQWLISNAVGMTMLNLNQSTLGRLPIRMPLLEHHSAILRFTGAIDRTIGYLDALIAAKREQKRGLMQQLLTGKVRFPGFTEPWKTVRLGDVVSVDPEQLPATTPADYLFNYIDLSSVNNGRIELPTSTTQFSSAPSRARRVLKTGDVLLSTVRPLLKGFGILTSDAGPFVGSTGFAVLRGKRQEDARFVFECLFSSPVLRQMHARTTGSSYPALGADDVRDLRIPWPSIPERDKIEALLTATTRELRLLEDSRSFLANERRGLMERLLSGDITIPSSDTSAA